MRNNYYIELIKHIENEISDWKYYKIVKNKSSIITTYLIYLKFLSDKLNENLFGNLIEQYDNSDEFNNEIIARLLHTKKEHNSGLNNTVYEYLKGIQLHLMPRDFIQIINEIQYIDFTNDAIVEDVADALIHCFGNLFSDSVREAMSQDDMQLVTCATELLNVETNMSIYDCSCGVGVFLAIATNTESVLYGQEIDIDKAVVAYMICEMKGAKNVNIEVGDVLQNPMTEKFGIIKVDRAICFPVSSDRLANSQKIHQSNNSGELLFGDSNLDSGSWIYARHIIQKLDENGIGVLIAPCSALSREGNTKDDRCRLICRNSINTVIQLPAGMFNTVANLCIIILEKGAENQKQKEIQMIDLSSKEGERYFYDSKCLNQIVISNQEIDGVSRMVGAAEIDKHDFNLTPSLYLRDMGELIMIRERTENMFTQCEELLKQYHESEEKLYNVIQRYYCTYE